MNIRKISWLSFAFFYLLLVQCTIYSQYPGWTVYNTSNSGIPSNSVKPITIDESGNKWIGTSGGGLAKFDGTNWTTYNTSNSGLSNNSLQTIAIDESGNKWIGTLGGGLAKFDGTNWTTYNSSNSGLPDNYVRSVAIDVNGDKWIGTVNKLAKYNGTNWTVYDTSNSGLPHNYVWSIAIDGNGNKWIGTSGGGLAKFDGTNWTTYNTSNSGLPNNLVRTISIDGSGNKWIGSPNGLTKYDGTNWTTYTTSNSGLPNNQVLSTSQDGSGNNWIATLGGGLAKYDGTNWTTYDTSNSGLPNNTVTSIVIDGSGNKWIGSGGVTKFNETWWIAITTPNGGENWQVRTQKNIIWTSSNILNIKIEYTTNNGTSWNNIVSSLSANSGSYTWDVPNSPSTQCKVRLIDVTDSTFSSISETIFTITSALDITSPSGGEIWQALSQQNITWTSGPIANLKIDYTTNNGTNWIDIVASIPAISGSYSWTVPNTPSNQCKVRLMDVDDNSIFSISHTFFTITPFPVSAIISCDSIGLDNDFDGLVLQHVNANQSVGNISSYDWFLKNVLVAQGVNPTLELRTGDNWLKLKVTDIINQIAYDSVNIRVYSAKSRTNGGIYSGVSQIGNQFYVTSLDKGVYCFDSTGVLTPPYMTGGSIQSTLAISTKNLLYTGSDDTRLYCFDLSLNSIWDKSMGGIIKASPSITTDGNTIYIGTNNGYLKSLDANNGNSKWTFIANGGIISSPTVVELVDSNQTLIETIIYFGTDNGVFYALKDKGLSYEQFWGMTTTPDSGIISSPAISPDGMIYFGSKNGYLYRVQWDGTYQTTWKKYTGGKIVSSPLIGKNDLVFVASESGFLYGYEKEFTFESIPMKQFQHQWGVNGTPSIGKDGNLYIGCNNGTFYKLEDISGNLDLGIKWYLTANSGIESPILATETGLVVVGCTNGDIYIMKDLSANIEGTENLNLAWPTFKGNNKRNKVTRMFTAATGLDNITELPSKFNLSQNYPNPFNPSTVISYELPVMSNVSLKVFDMIGNEVATLVNEEKPAGYHTVTFNAENFSTGVYFYQIKAGEFVSTKKLILMK